MNPVPRPPIDESYSRRLNRPFGRSKLNDFDISFATTKSSLLESSFINQPDEHKLNPEIYFITNGLSQNQTINRERCRSGDRVFVQLNDNEEWYQGVIVRNTQPPHVFIQGFDSEPTCRFVTLLLNRWEDPCREVTRIINNHIKNNKMKLVLNDFKEIANCPSLQPTSPTWNTVVRISGINKHLGISHNHLVTCGGRFPHTENYAEEVEIRELASYAEANRIIPAVEPPSPKREPKNNKFQKRKTRTTYNTAKPFVEKIVKKVVTDYEKEESFLNTRNIKRMTSEEFFKVSKRLHQYEPMDLERLKQIVEYKNMKHNNRNRHLQGDSWLNVRGCPYCLGNHSWAPGDYVCNESYKKLKIPFITYKGPAVKQLRYKHRPPEPPSEVVVSSAPPPATALRGLNSAHVSYAAKKEAREKLNRKQRIQKKEEEPEKTTNKSRWERISNTDTVIDFKNISKKSSLCILTPDDYKTLNCKDQGKSLIELASGCARVFRYTWPDVVITVSMLRMSSSYLRSYPDGDELLIEKSLIDHSVITHDTWQSVCEQIENSAIHPARIVLRKCSCFLILKMLQNNKTVGKSVPEGIILSSAPIENKEMKIICNIAVEACISFVTPKIATKMVPTWNDVIFSTKNNFKNPHEGASSLQTTILEICNKNVITGIQQVAAMGFIIRYYFALYDDRRGPTDSILLTGCSVYLIQTPEIFSRDRLQQEHEQLDKPSMTLSAYEGFWRLRNYNQQNISRIPMYEGSRILIPKVSRDIVSCVQRRKNNKMAHAKQESWQVGTLCRIPNSNKLCVRDESGMMYEKLSSVRSPWASQFFEFFSQAHFNLQTLNVPIEYYDTKRQLLLARLFWSFFATGEALTKELFPDFELWVAHNADDGTEWFSIENLLHVTYRDWLHQNHCETPIPIVKNHIIITTEDSCVLLVVLSAAVLTNRINAFFLMQGTHWDTKARYSRKVEITSQALLSLCSCETSDDYFLAVPGEDALHAVKNESNISKNQLKCWVETTTHSVGDTAFGKKMYQTIPRFDKGSDVFRGFHRYV